MATLLLLLKDSVISFGVGVVVTALGGGYLVWRFRSFIGKL